MKKCKKFPGGGILICVDHHRTCTDDDDVIKPHPDQKFNQYYLVCGKHVIFIGKCDVPGETFNKKESKCKNDRKPTALTQDDSNGNVRPIKCEKSGAFFKKNDNKCVQLCVATFDYYDLRIICQK